jgi:hypothetical protein
MYVTIPDLQNAAADLPPPRITVQFIAYLCGMNLLRIAIELFVLYLLYKLVFDLILPLARTTKEVKKQFHDMNSRVQNDPPPHSPTGNKPVSSKGDYIDFEEVK